MQLMILIRHFNLPVLEIKGHIACRTRSVPIHRIPGRAIFLLLFFSVFTLACPLELIAADTTSIISPENGMGRFALSASGHSAALYVSTDDYPGVIRALKQLQTDIYSVTDEQPELITGDIPAIKEMVLVGTLGKSPVIDRLVQEKKLDIDDIAGRWETFLIQVVESPLPGVKCALVIAGSDKRGTIFGIYELSRQIGISPWYWWADVPVIKQQDIYVLPGRYSLGEPAVKYRGIFINDEAPALSGWAYEKFGGFNHEFYEKVFELILRLKGNYLWPAMWGRAFYDDDTLNPILADEYGIVIGTSHHEPMMRAHDEWRRYGSGGWNYETNEDTLKAFWKQGIERMGSKESIVTIGMRGDGDEPMTEGTAIALLERIVRDQRDILEEVTGKKAAETPQMWALYKEVQDYYDKGMRVPDDVTLLLCDDNWGNIRKLPGPRESTRPGGYGIYYHFDYVGGPRNYKWLNTNQIERTWEQMNLAYHYGADRVWIVNVGDIKPMEFPVEFFLDYAWDPEKWPAERLPEYYRLWAKEQFGRIFPQSTAGKGSGEMVNLSADENPGNFYLIDSIADILAGYTRYNSRRKPELLSPETYSLINYHEAERIVTEYSELAGKAERLYLALPAPWKDAFYQLVLFPVKACANLNELYVTAGKNHLYAKQNRAATNLLAQKVRELFLTDAELTGYFHTGLAGGKWNHMMSQTHIGYTYWQQPEQNSMPEVVEIILPDTAVMGVAIEGSASWWPQEKREAILPEFDPCHQQTSYVEVFNQGKVPFKYTAHTGAGWLIIEPDRGTVTDEQRIRVSVDWPNVPAGKNRVPITISGQENNITIYAVINNIVPPERGDDHGFTENNGYVSIEAEHFTRAMKTASAREQFIKEDDHFTVTMETDSVCWQIIPNLGRTLSGIMPVPVTAQSQSPGGNSPHLEYRMDLFSHGKVKVRAYLSPTLNFNNNQDLRYAISFDDEPPQIINIHEDKTLQAWEKSVADNINITVSEHFIDNPGEHILKFWMVDPGVVLQRLVVETGDVRPSYLGPPESCRY